MTPTSDRLEPQALGRADLLDKFHRYVEPDLNSGCWIWSGRMFVDGYGKFRLSAKREIRAHRFIYEATHGAIPPGMIVLHSCDTPACVNPSHFRIGTHAENAADKASKGRSNGGARNRRFSAQERSRIIEMLSQDYSLRSIYREMKSTPSAIKWIRDHG